MTALRKPTMHTGKDGAGPSVRLVTVNGARVLPDPVPPIDAPEAMMDISFEGLTEAEQRAALAGFPGGRRFRLVVLDC